MSWKNSLSFRFTSLFRSSRLEDEMDQEIRSHFELLVEDFLSEGHDETAARRMARREFGNFDRAKEECRDTWGTRLLFDFFRDLRFASRLLLKSKGYSAVCILTIALGIAACSTVFSVVDGVLFRPLPFNDSDRMVTVWEFAEYGKNSVAGGSYLDWKKNSQSAAAMMIHNRVEQNLKRNGAAELLQGWETSSDFLDVLGVSTLLGRGFSEKDEQVGAAPVVLLPEETWRQRFNADPDILGETMVLNETAREIIGILPANTWLEPGIEFFIPAILDPNQAFRSGRDTHWAYVWARLKEGATAEQLQTELRSIKESLNAEYPEFKRSWTVAVEPFRELISSGASPVLWTLTAAVGCVLLIACSNVSNLVLARTINRRSELAMRATLGATRRRLVCQSLTESLLLSFAVGFLGLLLSLVSITLFRATSRETLPGALLPQLDLRALGAAILLTCGSALLFELLPSLVASRRDPKSETGTGGKASAHGGQTRIQSTLVVAEIALTIALLSAAGLLLKSLAKQLSEDPGYNVESAYTFDLNLPAETYRGREKRLAYIENLQEALKQVPNVQSASTLSASPLSRGTFGEFVSKSGKDSSESRPLASVIYVDENFFETVQARILAGRFFETFDNQAEAREVVVIDRTLAKNLFGDEPAVGQFVDSLGTTWEVAGVVDDLKLDPNPRSAGYLYLPQQYFPFVLSVVVRLQDNTPNALNDVRAAVQSIDSGIPMANTRTLQAAIEDTVEEDRYVLALLSIFAGIALLLAGTGMYSVMSYAVATRRREISIRSALGATRNAIKLLVVLSGAKLTLLGLACGVVAALALSRLIASQLYQVSPFDPYPLIISAAIITLTGLLASWIPACRIARLGRNDRA